MKRFLIIIFLFLNLVSVVYAGGIFQPGGVSASSPSFTGDITITKQDPSAIFNAGQSGDTKFWLGVQDNNDGVDNDTWQIGTGTTPGTNSKVTISNVGNITMVTGTLLSGASTVKVVNTGRFEFDTRARIQSLADSEISFVKNDGTQFVTLGFTSNILEQRNAANAQTYRAYGIFIDISNFERASLSTQAGASITLAAETAGTGGDDLGIILTPAGTGALTLTSGDFLFGTDNIADIGRDAVSRPNDVFIAGRFAHNNRQAIVVDGATTFAVTSGYITLACTGAETINTITGGITGLELVVEHTDAECTIADDDDPTAANAVNLSGTATDSAGAAGKTLKLLYNGTHWLQVGGAANA